MLDHELLVEPAAAAAAKDLGQQVERLGLAGFCRVVGRHHPLRRKARHRNARIGQRHRALGVLLRLDRADARRQVRTARDLAIGLFGQRLHRIRLDIAGHDQHGVVGPVVFVIEGNRVGAVQLLHLLHPADHRNAVGLVLPERRVDLLVEHRLRIAVDARAALFQDHVALGLDDLVGEDEVAHAVGLEAHHLTERRRRHRLVEGGVVIGGEGVVGAADGRYGAVELARGVVGRGLEHQMFEEVRDAGFAWRLVGAADLVPHHMGDDRGAVIGDDHHLHAVVEQEVRHLAVVRGQGRRRPDGQRGGEQALSRSHSVLSVIDGSGLLSRDDRQG